MEDLCVLIAFPSVAASFGMLVILKAVASRIAKGGLPPSNDPTTVAPRLHKGWAIVGLLVMVLVGTPPSIWYAFLIWDKVH